jgi:hypothetical protein
MPEIEGLARSAAYGDPVPGACRPTEALPLEQFGSPILSAPVLAGINDPIPLPIAVDVEALSAVDPGGAITYRAALTIDVYGLARGFLESRVLPVVEDFGLSEEFAASAWVRLVASDIRVRLPLPQGAAGAEVVGTEASGIRAASELGGGAVQIALDAFAADSRTESPPVEIAVAFTAKHKVDSPSAALVMGPESVAFAFALTVGIGDEDGPLVGGVRGSMAGAGADDLAVTEVRCRPL